MIRLELWVPRELQLATVPPQAEAEPHVVLVGTCFGHPLKEDGTDVATGKIASIRLEGNVIVARTVAGADYELGEPASIYEQVFPNARARILRWLRAKEAPVAEEPTVSPLDEIPEHILLDVSS